MGPMTVSAMAADQFWQIVWRAAQSDHDPDAHLEALRLALRELSREEVISFAAAFSRYRRDAYSRRCEGCEQFATEISWIGQDGLPAVPTSRTRQQGAGALSDPVRA
jgi:hypothetical protein